MDKTIITIEIELNTTGGSGAHYAAEIAGVLENTLPLPLK